MQSNELLPPDIIRKKVRSARLINRRSMKACADFLDITLDRYCAYETGAIVPSLPEILLLCSFFKINPLTLLAIDENTIALHPNIDSDLNNSTLKLLNQKIIGAKIRYLRLKNQLNLAQLALMTSISEEDLDNFEFGRLPIQLTILYRILYILGAKYSYLFDADAIDPTIKQDQSRFTSQSTDQTKGDNQDFTRIDQI